MSAREKENVDRHGVVESNFGNYSMDVLYGLINGIMVFPVSISFCSIIFRNEFFQAHMPVLVKLVLFSSAIHQLTFAVFSSLPFAVGQVQDAGLIFLSAIASSIVEAHLDQEVDSAVTLTTVLVILGVCTFTLGVCLVIIGRLRLASYLQYLPMPVVGGYLAFIGFFCGSAGLGMMAGEEIASISDWPKLWNANAVTHIAPGFVAGCLYYVLLYTIKSPWTLPICMLTTLLLFYVTIFALGWSFEFARDDGWLMPDAPHEPFYKMWTLYDVQAVDWSQLLPQVWRWLGMVLVVAFSSSLDVAAIEMELGKALDYDNELTTVGLGNMFSGLLGGYSGSYIFSQTIFNLRRGVRYRVCGYIIGGFELLLLVLPISVASFMPKLLFGALLVLISVDLINDWLISSWSKMSHMEYAVCWLTFTAIQFLGIELGLLTGLLLAVLCFTAHYMILQRRQFSAMLNPSTHGTQALPRNYQRMVAEITEDLSELLQLSPTDRVVVIPLVGYIFFGSAVGVLQEILHKLAASGFEVKGHFQPQTMSGTVGSSVRNCWLCRAGRHLCAFLPLCCFCGCQCGDAAASVCCCAPETDEYVQLVPLSATGRRMQSYGGTDSTSSMDNDDLVMQSMSLGMQVESGIELPPMSPASKMFRNSNSNISSANNIRRSPSSNNNGELGTLDEQQKLNQSRRSRGHQSDHYHSHHVLVLDFRAVLGVDATATRSCFLMLAETVRLSGYHMVYINIEPDTEQLLRVHKVILDNEVVIRRYPSADRSSFISSPLIRSEEF